jgi:murein DD-endopeptidase MepM/ murein hydrolase activator NlpD
VAYAASADSAAVSAWDAAGSAALRSRLYVQPTFDEILEFPADAPVAVAYRFRMSRGERVDVEISAERGQPLFADVFEVIDTSMFRHVYAPARSATRFEYTATTDGEHILRLQPSLHEGGRYKVHVSGSAAYALTFPVEGMSPSAIAGYWGDARDGGARDHKGVDIFAPRGTNVLAAAAGTITTVETTATGGRVVWERDDARGLLYFYAHLDEQLAVSGRKVSAGDVIGTVGNTGNASGGSTHLHFGVYLPGYVAQNPTPYLTARATVADASDAQIPASLGTRVRLSSDHVRLRMMPGESGPVLDQLNAGTDMLLLGYVNGWSRVVLDDGKTGFVASWLLPGDRSAGTHLER